MRLQRYKPDEARALTASPKLSAIYLHDPLHHSALFPLAPRPCLILFLMCPSLLFHWTSTSHFTFIVVFISVFHPLTLTTFVLFDAHSRYYMSFMAHVQRKVIKPYPAIALSSLFPKLKSSCCPFCLSHIYHFLLSFSVTFKFVIETVFVYIYFF